MQCLRGPAVNPGILASRRSSHSYALRAVDSKGFSSSTKGEAKKAQEAESKEDFTDSAEAVEARLKGKRKKRVEPKVRVQSAVVDQVTGKAPQSSMGQAETAVVQGLLVFFVLVLLEGLILAGSGFLPEEADAFIQDVLYPSFSPTVAVFLLCSSLYGLWKTGKLPGQQQL